MKRYKFSLSLLMFLILLISCQSEGLNIDEQRNNEANIKTFLISMPKQSIVQTSDSEGAKKLIDFKTLKIFIFNSGKDGKYIKTLIPNELDKITYDDELKGYRVPINFIGFDEGAKVDMVIIANGDGIKDPEQDQTKSDYCEKLTLDLNGKWDPNKKIPFWGEYKNFEPNGFDGTKAGKEIKISLLRSLAQISFQVNGAAKDNIKLQNVYVYNSLNKACLVPKSANLNENESEFTVTAPTVADGAGINVDPQSKFLSYLKKEGVTDSSVLDLIYVPEQKAGTNNLFLIIAAKYGNSTENSYYRIDLKNKDNKGAPFDILRNHNYVVKIKSVTGPGFETQEDALKAGPSNIDVEIVEWDNDISIGYIWGDKNFGVNTSKLVFESKSGLTKKIKYQTNLSKDQIRQELKYSLDDEGSKHFKVSLDAANKELIVTTINENNGATDFKGILSLYREDPKKAFTIELVQKTPNLDYSINCDSTKVNGVYKEDSLLGDNNYIEVTVNSHLNLKDRFYEIKTNKVGGISFESHGTFPEFEKDKSGKGFHTTIRLKGTGTPISRAPKDLLISYNSINLINCSVIVKMAYSKKLVLGVTFDWNNSNGDPTAPGGFAMENGLSKLFRESEDNFGMKNYSAVKIEKFEYETVQFLDYYHFISKTKGPVFIPKSNDNLRVALAKNPDIIVWGYPSIITKEAGEMLAEYLKKDGCLILMCQNMGSFGRFFKALYGKEIGFGFNEIVKEENQSPEHGYGLCFDFKNLPGDPVLAGPFGDVNGQVWGEDDGYTKALTDFPEEDMIVYSNSVPSGIESRYLNENITYVNRGVTSFRHAKYNLIVITDAGFIGGLDTRDGYSMNMQYPYMINILPEGERKKGADNRLWEDSPICRPHVKTGYGGNITPNKSVCNSIFFGNALAYMIDRAEFHGINTGVK